MEIAGLSPLQICVKFCKLYNQFACELAEVFPECSSICDEAQKSTDLLTASEQVQEGVVREWDSKMQQVWNDSSFYQHVKARNEAIFKCVDHLPFVRTMNFDRLWNDMELDSESKESLWMYIDLLNKYSRFFCIMPKNMLETISKVFIKYVEVDENGAYKLSKTTDYSVMLQDIMGEFKADTSMMPEEQMRAMTSFIMDYLPDVLGPNNENIKDILNAAGIENMDTSMLSGLLSEATKLISGGMPMELANIASSECLTNLLHTFDPAIINNLLRGSMQ